jgi:ankyrin repeat protein
MSKKAQSEDKLGRSLTYASKSGNIAKCKAALDEGSEEFPLLIHYRYSGSSSIIWSSSEGHLDIVQLLESRGANVNDKGSENLTSLCWAAGRGRWKVVEFLLSKGANVNDRSTNGLSAMLWAARNGHVRIVKLLLSNGASLYDTTTLYNVNGDNCLSLTIRNLVHPHLSLSTRFQKWPLSMAIIALKALGVYHHLDAQSIIDLHQYLGIISNASTGPMVPSWIPSLIFK